MNYFLENNKKQNSLLNNSSHMEVANDNPVRLIDAFVDSLNLNKLGIKSKSKNDSSVCKPELLLKLYIYGNLNKIKNSKVLESECSSNVELLWLLREYRPDHKTIDNFKEENKEGINDIFQGFLYTFHKLKTIIEKRKSQKEHLKKACRISNNTA